MLRPRTGAVGEMQSYTFPACIARKKNRGCTRQQGDDTLWADGGSGPCSVAPATVHIVKGSPLNRQKKHTFSQEKLFKKYCFLYYFYYLCFKAITQTIMKTQLVMIYIFTASVAVMAWGGNTIEPVAQGR